MIDALRAENPGMFRARDLCEAFDVSRSGYYAHRQKEQRPRRREDRRLAPVVVECFKASRRTYGSVRLQEDLRDRGHRAGRRRIARLMRRQGLKAKTETPLCAEDHRQPPWRAGGAVQTAGARRAVRTGSGAGHGHHLHSRP